MEKKESVLVIGGIVAGIAIAGSLFLLYPDMMFKNTRFSAQQGTAPPVTAVSPTITAGAGSYNNTTNSTSRNTTGGSTPAPPAKGPPSY